MTDPVSRRSSVDAESDLAGRPERTLWGQVAAASCAHLVVIGAGYMSAPPLFGAMHDSGVGATSDLLSAWAITSLGGGLGALAPVALKSSTRATGFVSGLAAAAALALRGLVNTPLHLDLAMFGYGAASGALLGVLTKSVSDATRPEDEGMAQGVFFSAYAFGAAIAAGVSAPLSTFLGGWRPVFLFWGALAVVAVVAWGLPTRRDLKWRPTDSRDLNAASDLAEVSRALRSLAPLCLAYSAYVGAYLGFSGLAPMALERQGWSATEADTAISLPTIGFVAGALALPLVAKRMANASNLFAAAMFVAGGLSAAFLLTQFDGVGGPAALMLVSMGFACGAMSIFFAILGTAPAANGPYKAAAFGLATSASYAGGFVFPLALSLVGSGRVASAAIIAIAGFGVAGVAVWVDGARKWKLKN